jgi:hypothetical protein
VLAAPVSGQVIPGVIAGDRTADVERYRARVHADMDSLLLRYEKAWSRREPTELAALFATDGALATEGRPPVRGRGAIARTLAGTLPHMRWGHFSTRVVDVNDDVAYVVGTAEFEWNTPAAERYRMTVPFSLTAKRAFPEPWLITWQKYDVNVTLPAPVLALAPGARVVRRAEGELWPGDSLAEIGRVGNATGEFIAFDVHEGHRDFAYFLHRQAERVDENGTPALRIVERREGRGTDGPDTAIVRLRTLEPVRQSSVRDGKRESARFEALRIRGVARSEGGDLQPLDLALTDPVYSAAALPELLQALPLATAPYAKFRLFDSGGGVRVVATSIVGSEELELADGRKLATWIVWVSGDSGRQTLWLAKDTQQLVQMVTPLDGGRERWLVRMYTAEGQ